MSDDTLAVPLGGIVDAAVGPDGTIYLLDRQTCVVQRITSKGDVLTPLGRKGEGPAELSQPALVVVDAMGRCTVVQDFYARAVCFDPSGQECAAADMSPLRDGYFLTVYTRATVDHKGRLLVGTIRSKSGGASEGEGSASITRLGSPGEGGALRLLSSEEGATDAAMVRLPPKNRRLVYSGWDVSPRGVFAHADPGGTYSVYIGHTADGPRRKIVLPWKGDDDHGVRRALEQSGIDTDPEAVAKVVSLAWLDDEYLLVQPVSEWSKLTPGVIGVYDLVGKSGDVVGRWSVRCRYDPEADLTFIRRDRLIVIEGGASSLRAGLLASGMFVPSQGGGTYPDEIRVSVYQLFADERMR
ncbi:MAG TPA: hypothetical protein VEC56_07560 [Candidatus Krumholzibacteria bacterium]|nr:hypothetical protein [Candidatus Krumholzibacteria bacterium]